jgi:hypothetical protein
MDSANYNAGFDCYDTIISQEIRTEGVQETVVPDTMPDIAEIVESAAVLMLRSKDVESGRASLEATAAVSVVYKPEEGGALCCLEMSVPVRLSIENEAIGTDMLFSASLYVAGLETRLLNPRKVTARAEICGRAEVYSASRFDLGSCSERLELVHYKTDRAELTPVVSVREKTFVLTDEYTLPPSRAAARELLCRRVSITVDEARSVGKKLIFKGSVRCSLLYCSVDGLPAAAEFTTGFSQIMESEADGGEQLSSLAVMLTGAYFEILPSSDGRSISAELHLVAQLTARMRLSAEYVSDAYSNVRELTLGTGMRSETCLRRCERLQSTVAETLELPSAGAEVIDAFASPALPEVDGGRIRLPLTVTLLYRGGDGEIHMFRKRMCAQFATELGPDEYLVVQQTDAGDILTAPGAQGMELRVRASASVAEFARLELPVVSGVECGEEALSIADRPSLVLVMASEGDSLWNLARENCSSPEAIEKANDFSSFGEGWHRLILVPKTK